MLSGIEYFKKMYEQVPNWVQVMHDYNPEMLTLYTQFRAEAFKDSVLSAIEKDELIAALNAGRLYGRSMCLHTDGAQNKGSKLENLIEYFLVAGHYKGKDALQTSLHAIKQFVEKDQNIKLTSIDTYATVLDVLKQIQAWTTQYDQSFLNKVISGLKEGKAYVDLVFTEGTVTTARKYLAYVGMYITQLDGANANEAIKLARRNGVSEAEMAELGYVIIFTSGIPSWFEISDHLKPIKQ